MIRRRYDSIHGSFLELFESTCGASAVALHGHTGAMSAVVSQSSLRPWWCEERNGLFRILMGADGAKRSVQWLFWAALWTVDSNSK